jgi:hypothetical protein
LSPRKRLVDLINYKIPDQFHDINPLLPFPMLDLELNSGS